MERKQEQKCLFEVEMDGGNEHEKIAGRDVGGKKQI